MPGYCSDSCGCYCSSILSTCGASSSKRVSACLTAIDRLEVGPELVVNPRAEIIGGVGRHSWLSARRFVRRVGRYSELVGTIVDSGVDKFQGQSCDRVKVVRCWRKDVFVPCLSTSTQLHKKDTYLYLRVYKAGSSISRTVSEAE